METVLLLLAIQLGAIIVTRLISDPDIDTQNLELSIAETETEDQIKEILDHYGTEAMKQYLETDNPTNMLVADLLETVSVDDVADVIKGAAEDPNLRVRVLQSATGYLGYIIKNITKNIHDSGMLNTGPPVKDPVPEAEIKSGPIETAEAIGLTGKDEGGQQPGKEADPPEGQIPGAEAAGASDTEHPTEDSSEDIENG
jgi:hypothetical protein